LNTVHIHNPAKNITDTSKDLQLWAGSRVAKSAGALEPPQVGPLEPPQEGKARGVPAPAPEALGRRKDLERKELWWKDAVVAIYRQKTTILVSATFS
jgi:hypothetical protein